MCQGGERERCLITSMAISQTCSHFTEYLQQFQLRMQISSLSNDYTKKICVQFPGMVYAYRNRFELAALCTLDQITDQTRAFEASDWTFFVVENSTYVKEIVEESQGIYSFSQLIHFAVVGGQALFEVITDAIPILTEGWGFWSEDTKP